MPSAGTSPFGLPGEPGTVETSAGSAVVARAPLGPSSAPDSLSGVRPNVYVTVETNDGGSYEVLPNLNWSRITFGRDGADVTARLYAYLDATKLTASGSIGSEHFAHLIARLNNGRRIRIVQTQASHTSQPIIYFDGYVLERSPAWNGREQRLELTAYSVGQQALRHDRYAQVLGRWMRFAPLTPWKADQPDLIEVSALPPVFNAGGRPNRSVELYSMTASTLGLTSPYDTHLFVDDDAPLSGQATPDVRRWRYVDAIVYVAVHYVARAKQRGRAAHLPISVEELAGDLHALQDSTAVDPNSNDPFVRKLTAVCDDVSIASMNAEEALVTLCRAAGLHFETAYETGASGATQRHFARITASIEDEADRVRENGAMIPAYAHDIAREAPFTDHSSRGATEIASENRHDQVNLIMDGRTITRPIILGGFAEFEVTLLLRPGWLPHIKLDNLPDDEARDAALTFWDEEFAEEKLESGVPTSIYHGEHPAHGKLTTDAIQTFLPADVGRLWIFPDDHRWASRADTEFESPYARGADAAPQPGGDPRERPYGPWPARLYSPYDPQDIGNLVYVRGDIGGDIARILDIETGRRSDFDLPRRRPFRDIIGRIRQSGDPAPVIRFNFIADDPFTALADPNWLTFSGQAHIDAHRAAISLIDGNLLYGAPFVSAADGQNMIEAYMGFEGVVDNTSERKWGRPHFHVSVTCTVRSDRRMMHRAGPSLASPVQERHAVIDTGLERFRLRRRRGQNSFLDDFEPDPDPAYENRDDLTDLERFGKAEYRRLGRETVSGTLSTFYIDPTINLGDSFSGVSGLGLPFERYPEVVAKSYIRNEEGGYATELHLSDLRESPEVGT